jgi:hypothetical protein
MKTGTEWVPETLGNCHTWRCCLPEKNLLLHFRQCCSRYSDWLRAGRSGDRIPVGASFSAPVQTGPGAHPASCTMGTGSFQGIKSGRSVTLTPHPLIVPWSWKSRAIPLLPLWAVLPVQSLSACTRVHFIFTLSNAQTDILFFDGNFQLLTRYCTAVFTKLNNSSLRVGSSCGLLRRS